MGNPKQECAAGASVARDIDGLIESIASLRSKVSSVHDIAIKRTEQLIGNTIGNKDENEKSTRPMRLAGIVGNAMDDTGLISEMISDIEMCFEKL